jgi:hypothetical protein
MTDESTAHLHNTLVCPKRGQTPFDSATASNPSFPTPINASEITMPDKYQCSDVCIPWVMQLKAISAEDPSRLVQSLTGAILGCGGWVLRRGANDTGKVNILFEFERQACVDIYTLLIAAGVELNRNAHTRFTELCQCTRSQAEVCATEIASIDLDIQTYPPEMLAPGTVSRTI